MKKFLMTAIVALVMTATAIANDTVTTREYSQATDSKNITEKLITIINGYTAKINAVESVYDLFFVSEKCYKEKMAFEKKYAEEIAAFNKTLTAEKKAANNEAIRKAMNEFEAAVNIKAKILSEEQGAGDEKK